MTLLSLAGRNLKRSFFRNAAIAFSVAVVAATLFSVAALMGSAGTALERGAARLGAELIIVPQGETETMTRFIAGHVGAFKLDMQHEILGDVKNIGGVRTAAPLLFLPPSDETSSFAVVGYDPKTDFIIKPWLQQNRPFSDNDVIAGGKVSYGKNETVMVFGKEMTVAGKLEATGLSFLDNSLFLPLPVAWELTGKPGRLSAIMVMPEINDAAYMRMLILTIQRRIKGVTSLMAEDMISAVRKHLSTLMSGIILTVAVIWIIALIMIGVIFSMTMNERQREIGLLRAMGATKMHVFSLAMLEAASLSALGGVAGIIAGGMLLFAFNGVIESLLNVQTVLPGYGVFLLIIISLLISFISGTGAALLSALRSSMMEPQQAISKGN